eukprot:c21043_g1_i1.p1 GENE.c21043_g1_i1~~c21043_g1_i1.p1  ORF type:complete len:283 (+),score=36.92 c21043_g1_i1:46-849(+)
MDEDFLLLDDDEAIPIEELQQNSISQQPLSQGVSITASSTFLPPRSSKFKWTRKGKNDAPTKNEGPNLELGRSSTTSHDRTGKHHDKQYTVSSEQKRQQRGQKSAPLEDPQSVLPHDDTSFCRFHPHEFAPYECVRCGLQYCYTCAIQIWRETHPKEARILDLARAALASGASTKKGAKPWLSRCATCGASDCEIHKCDHHGQPQHQAHGEIQATVKPVLRCPLCAKSPSWRNSQYCANLFIFILALAVVALCVYIVIISAPKFKRN